jgi:hypothetical protein
MKILRVRISEEAEKKLAKDSAKYGMSQANYIEFLINNVEIAVTVGGIQKEGIAVPENRGIPVSSPGQGDRIDVLQEPKSVEKAVERPVIRVAAGMGVYTLPQAMSIVNMYYKRHSEDLPQNKTKAMEQITREGKALFDDPKLAEAYQ